MDQAPRPLLRSQAVPKLQPHRTHTRDVSRSPTRERGNLSDDILADLSPATTLEAFTNPSGKLKASVENATQSERAFGIRATWASKKIQEWLDELSNWAWPTDGGSQGFEMPPMMRRKTTEDSLEPMGMMDSPGASSIGVEYMGSLPIDTFDHYEVRVEEITEDMEDLDVEDIKRQVLDTHFSPRSRPSSSASGSPMPSVFASYTKMDDLTAIVTATVLHALPNLSNLLRLMDVWKVRLAVLSKVPPLLSALDEIETALEAGWHALGKSSSDGTHGVGSAPLELSRASFDNMRHGLQDKVAVLGRDLDFMLDTLEGRNETLPDIWLDRMEAIEHNYGEWVVHGDRKIREVEWAKMMNARKEAADTWRLEEAREVEEARLREETETAQRARVREEQAALEAEETQQQAQNGAPSHGLEAKLLDANPLSSVSTMEPPAVTEPVCQSVEVVNNEQVPANALIVEHLSNGLEHIHANGAPRSHPEDKGVEPSELSRPASQAETETNENDIEVQAAYDSLSTTSLEFQRVEGIPVGLEEQWIAAPNPNDLSIQAPSKAQPVSSDGQNVQSQVLSGSDGSQELGATERPKTRSLLTSSLFDEDRDGSPPISRLITRSPKSPPQAPRFGHTVSNMLRRTSSPPKPSQDVFPPVRSSISPVTNARMFALHIDRFGNAEPSNSSWPTERRPATSSGVTEPHAQSSMRGDWGPVYFYKAQSPKSIGSTSENSHASVTSGRTSKRHSRNVSTVSGYPSLVPTPETGSTATVEYFQPALQPVTTQSLAHEGNRQEAIDVAPATMPESSTVTTNSANVTSTTCLPDESDPAPQLAPHYPSNVLREIAEPNPNDLTSEYHNAVDKGSTELEERASTPSAIKIPRKLSLIPLEPSRPATASSDTLTIVAGWSDGSISPTAPNTIDGNDGNFPSVDEFSPSAGRVGYRPTFDNDRSPSGSPPSVSIAPSRRQTLHSPTSPTFSLSSEPSESSASSLADAPAFENVNIQQKAAPLSSPKKQSEDQLQQQISSLLESIPARIHLTSEPAVAATNTLRPKKTRRSVTPSFRSQSSLSNRVSTPSFLLSPAYSKTASRPRPQSVHPEIKLYHLSRSADEAPIKLFVRLVGENGERVMVRVGGGWADLGEYLKEYASHHGRRSTVEDKIEIQDLPPRIVSNSSTTSNSTIRGSEYGRSSPMPNFRPATAFDRPASSLNVRKTRKSIGERVIGQRHNVRSPSTPLPMLNRRSLGDSPPPHSTTTTARSSSRLSWAEDDSSLGLAGPKGKKVAISEKDQEWVESMKKKVKQASAEKDRERERGRRIKEKARGESFGEMDKVGGTKRLFRKGPN